MTSVKPAWPPGEVHLHMLIGLLFQRLAEAMDEQDLHGLRHSHFRVMQGVAADGISVTDLAERIGMTKQGCGQFVRTLTESGHLRTAPDPGDGRVRLVHRTEKGERTLGAFRDTVNTLEAELARDVGGDRYREFRG